MEREKGYLGSVVQYEHHRWLEKSPVEGDKKRRIPEALAWTNHRFIPKQAKPASPLDSPLHHRSRPRIILYCIELHPWLTITPSTPRDPG